MDEDERRKIAESGHVYLANGVRVRFYGYKSQSCEIFGPEPGTKMCSWETAREVASRPDRRFLPTDHVEAGSWPGWGGVYLRRENFQTEKDYKEYSGPGILWVDAMGDSWGDLE